jgi:hypothetical protein
MGKVFKRALPDVYDESILRLSLVKGKIMRTKVSENGVVIPKELLEGITEVDIRKQNGVIVVIPAGRDDPIYDIGKDPVRSGVSDASENLDKYLYGGE